MGSDRVGEVLSPFVVRVEGVGARPDRLVDSQVPLVADDEGRRELVDLDLVRAGDGFEPDNGPVGVRLGARLSEGIGLGPLRVTPQGEAEGELLDSDTLSYANAELDSDVAVNVTPTGFETFHLLRSEDSPELQRLSLDLPAGAALEPAEGGGARVVQDGREKVRIRPPVAVDADGERVPVSYRVEGSQLLVVTRHRAGDWEWPILVDPEFEVKEDWACSRSWDCTTTWFHGQALEGLNFWSFESNAPYAGRQSCYADSWMNDCYRPLYGGPAPQYQWQPDGLHVLVRPNTYYQPNSYGQWVYVPPGHSTQVYRVDFGAKFLRNGRTGPANPYLYHGIWSAPSGGWADVEAHFGDAWGNLTHHWSADWGSGHPGPQRVAFGFYSFGGQLGSYWRTGYMGAAIIQLTDPEPPTITEAEPTLQEAGAQVDPGKWTRDGTFTFAPRASDPGLGVRFMRVEVPLAGGGAHTHERGIYCQGTKGSPCPSTAKLPFNNTQPPVSFSAGDADGNPANGSQPLPEGEVPITIRAADALGRGTDEHGRPHEAAVTRTAKIDRSGPSLALSGDLWDQRIPNASHLDVSAGQDLYELRIEARDGVRGGAASQRRSGVRDVAVFIDGEEEDRFQSDEGCQDSCEVVVDDFVLDSDWLTEGEHTLKVVASDRLGHRSETSFAVRVVRDDYYAGQLESWRLATERRVDDALPAVPLTGRMPSPPSDWRRGEQCESSTEALRSCYDAVAQWGREVRRWLVQNLPGGNGASGLEDPPTFEYSYGEDTSRDLTRRVRDSFALAKRSVADPLASLPVAIGFHEPVDPAQLAVAVPGVKLLQQEGALAGIYDPGGADWQGQVQIPVSAPVTDSVDEFYAKQAEMAAQTVQELEQEQPLDAEDAEDFAAALAEARAFKAHLDARRPFVTGVALRLDLASVFALLGDVGNRVKSIEPLSQGDGFAAEGADAVGASATDAATVRQAAATEPTAARSAVPGATGAATREPTCDQEGQGGALKRRLLDPHPHYWAPTRHKADSVLGEPDGDGHMKVHRLRFRWRSSGSLLWPCSDRPGDRNMEIEAKVYPDRPDEDDPRWSDNWESNSARKYTQTNMPGNIHQDDIASGESPGDVNPFDKQYYPDFAIVAQSARSFRYRKLYLVNFTTNEGQTDSGNERVIYSAQATRRARTFLERQYCGKLRGGDYKSCMFSTVDVCYAVRPFSSGPVHTRVGWYDLFPIHAGFSPSVSQWRRGADNGRTVTTNCDARPPGSGRT